MVPAIQPDYFMFDSGVSLMTKRVVSYWRDNRLIRIIFYQIFSVQNASVQLTIVLVEFCSNHFLFILNASKG